jgi:hypothetical protein
MPTLPIPLQIWTMNYYMQMNEIKGRRACLDFSDYLRTSALGADNTVEYLVPPGHETAL